MSATAVDGVLPGSAHAVHPDSPDGATIPWPPFDLMYFVGAPTPENYFFVGEAWSGAISRFVGSGCRLLDVGCGSGRTARFLADDARITEYVGFDVVPEAIDWCQRFITPRTGGRFRFERIDARSAAYNPGGAVPAASVRFPAADRSMHLAVAASVFTHLNEPDALHYLEELSRVLVRGGLALVSVHKETVPGLPWNGNEHRVDVYPPYFEALAARASLVVHEDLGFFCGEELFVFESIRVR